MKHPVRKLIIRLFIVSIPLLIMMLFTLIFPLHYMAVEYSMWAEEKDYTLHGEAANTLIIGDSRAKSGLIPALISTDENTVYNMAVGGTTSIEMYYALDTYLKNHPAPDHAVILFAPYHFCDIDNWNQTLYYNYLSIPQLSEVYYHAIQFHDPVILADNWFTDVLSYKLRLPNKYLAAQYNAGFIGRYADNQSKWNSVRNDLGYTEFGTDAGNDGANYETHHEVFDSSALLVYYYDHLLTLCDENDIRVTIAQSPINQASYDLITDEFWQGYHEMLSEEATKHPNITVNYDVVPYDNKYFGDNNHLNKEGAIKYSKEGQTLFQ